VSGRHSPQDHYRFSGEFHYFRVPRRDWRDRLARVRDLGFDSVSIYVPWNWHEPQPGAVDFTGRMVPERDLLGALEEIAAAGLSCIYRPGPFITAEWRDGGIPAWLWQRDPSIVALDAEGSSAGADRPYPALTYSHPGYEKPAAAWLKRSIEVAAGHLASSGGPIVHLQLDDESSYWQQLADPLALDYNPYLVDAEGGRPSRYADWLLRRHGSLDAVNAAQRTLWSAPSQIEPPRTLPAIRADLIRHVDWLEFKLDAINEHVEVLEQTAREAGYDGPISMLFPYLLPLQAARFAEFARVRMPDLELTNECYLSLFAATDSSEQKVAHVIGCHETYQMWHAPEQGPPFTMELQGSNSSFIAPGVMEWLYAVTLARGIRGFNVYMLAGGENPPGYELGTGREYDLDAPIGREGRLRPHAAVLARQIRATRAIEAALLTAEPMRDTWIGCYAPYEAAAMVGGRSAFADVDAAVKGIFSTGNMGMSGATSLTALLTLANVSLGALDLERGDADAWRRARQIWLPGLDFMARPVQEHLVEWMRGGGHLVVLPAIPTLDEHVDRCDVLSNAIYGSTAAPAFPAFEAEPTTWSQVRTASNGSLPVAGVVANLAPPPDATPIAWAEDGSVAGFTRSISGGTATVLGFRLQYHPVGGHDQFSFATELVEIAGGPRAAHAEALPVVALEMAGPDGGMVCVVNPTELPTTSAVTYTNPGTSDRLRLPQVLPGVEFAGRGARMLPVGIDIGGGLRLKYATAELLARGVDSVGHVRLTFASQAGESFEVALESPASAATVRGGRLVRGPNEATMPGVMVVESYGAEVEVDLAGPGLR
jgi:beta-galactosidase